MVEDVDNIPAGPLVTVDVQPGPFIEEQPSTVVIHPHKQQQEAYEAEERFVLILAGTRGGKTALGPFWLLREMQRKGPGEYLACAPSYPLFKKGAYKAIRRVFEVMLRLGKVIGGATGEFHFSEEGHKRVWPDHPYDPESKIVFAHAANPDSLEAAEYKAAWLDEPGQRGFPIESWEAIQRRLSIDRGRALMTTTPYIVHHWIVDEVYTPFKRRGTSAEQPEDKYNRVVSFHSISNPAFPRDEWDRAKATLPDWKFRMFFMGELTRPAGLIYDCIDPDYHFIPSYEVPPEWPRLCGVDFGAPNFAAIFLAEQMAEVDGPTKDGKPKLVKTGRYVAYREYRPDASKTAKEHVEAMKRGEPRMPDIIVGGAMSEGQWRNEFRAAGWPIREPDQKEVEVGIARVYSLFKTDRLFVMDSCPRLIEELKSYSREVDEDGNAIDETIADKERYHGADSLRYIGSWIDRTSTGFGVWNLTPGGS